MAHTRPQDWAAFPGNIDGTPAWITTDLAYGESPDPALPIFVHVRFPLPGCNEEGLPSLDGLHLIEKIEDQMLPIMEERKALHVGSMSHNRLRHVFFYAANDRGLAEALRPLAAIFPGSAPSAMSKPDPDAEMYTSLLLPDDWQAEFIQNHRVCAVLEGSGDNGEVLRSIEHLALFNDLIARERFAAKVAELGYTIKPVDDDGLDAEDPVYALHFEHHGPADPFDLTERTLLLAESATDFEGEYDGWQCQPQQLP